MRIYLLRLERTAAGCPRSSTKQNKKYKRPSRPVR
nr:MAG TPA: hypothetical protein [Caudoviricetes sp.]